MGTGGQSARSTTFVDDASTIDAEFLNTWLQDGLVSLTEDVRTAEALFEEEHYGAAGDRPGEHRGIAATGLVLRNVLNPGTDDAAVLCSAGDLLDYVVGGERKVLVDGVLELALSSAGAAVRQAYRYLAAKSFTERVPVSLWRSEKHSTEGEQWEFEEDDVWHPTVGSAVSSRLIVPLPVPVGASLAKVQLRYHLDNDGMDSAVLTTKLWHRTSAGTSQVTTDEGDTYELLPTTTDETDWRDQTPLTAPVATSDSEFFLSVEVSGAYSANVTEILAARRTISTLYAHPAEADA